MENWLNKTARTVRGFLERTAAKIQAWGISLLAKNVTTAAQGAEIESPEEPAGLGSRLKALALRGLNGREAYRCCVGARRSDQFTAWKYYEAVETVWKYWSEHRPQEAFSVPLAGVAVRELSIALEAAGAVGAVRLVMGSAQVFELSDVEISAITAAELQRLRIHIGNMTETMRKQEEDCLDCIEKKLWSQSNPRKKLTAPALVRLGGTGRK